MFDGNTVQILQVIN